MKFRRVEFESDAFDCWIVAEGVADLWLAKCVVGGRGVVYKRSVIRVSVSCISSEEAFCFCACAQCALNLTSRSRAITPGLAGRFGVVRRGV